MKKGYRVFQTAEVGGYKFAILLDDEDKRAYEAVNFDGEWETDFCYPALGIDSLDVAGATDFETVKKMGYTFSV